MLIEAKCSLENECIVGYYYLIYYALFQVMQANLIICIHYDDNKVIQLTHENVKYTLTKNSVRIKNVHWMMKLSL